MIKSATVIEGRGLFSVDGKRVRELRLERGYSQLEVALLAQLMQSTISRIESGRMTGVRWVTLERLGAVFGTPPDSLRGLRDVPRPARRAGRMAS